VLETVRPASAGALDVGDAVRPAPTEMIKRWYFTIESADDWVFFRLADLLAADKALLGARSAHKVFVLSPFQVD
jgi:hypothetical protein